MSETQQQFDMETSFHSLVDQDEVKYKVINDLNKIFGSNVDNLSKAAALVQELTKKKDLLEQTLRFTPPEVPDKVSKAVQAAEQSLEKHKELADKCDTLIKKAGEHTEKVKSLIDSISPGVHQVQEAECAQSYQRWIRAVTDISCAIESAIKSNDEDLLIEKYGELEELVEHIQGSQCLHLKEFTEKSIIYWHNVLYDKFKKDFEGILKIIKWPFSSNTSIRNASTLEDNLIRLTVLTKHLLLLTLPTCLENSTRQNMTDGPGIVADFPSLLPPLQILFRPFEVRFCYHFTGTRATNNRENPEWYFTQALQWMSLHDAFLDTWIQPVFKDTPHNNISAKVEFMRTLVRLIVLKLASDLPEIMDDDDLFCKTIQETLNFERELRLGFGYPNSQPSVLSVLTLAHHFNSWITIERKFALELMDEIVSADNAWHSVEPGEAAHCGEQLILLLQGITDRYKPLPQPGHRIQFLELQLELVDDFRVRVLQLMKSEKDKPLTSNYGSILNTVYHVANTLRDWDDTPFFVEMQYYREQLSNLKIQQAATACGSSTAFSCYSTPSFSSHGASSSTGDTSFDSTTYHASPGLSAETLARQDAFDSLNSKSLVPTPIQLTEVESTVFEDAIKLYLRIQTDMLKTMTDHVFNEVRAKSQSYRKDKWFISHQEGQPKLKVTDISPSFCMMLEMLTRNLLILRNSLNVTLFTESWHKITDALDEFVYEEVILQNHFSEYGAKQLQHDMYQALFPIFGEFTAKPENYFKHVKESVILLNLPRPTAQLLRETLKLSREESSISFSVSPVKALAEHGVSLLSPQEADTILNIRTNMASI